MPAAIDLTGQRFGKLVALYVHPELPLRHWVCQCDCGRQSVVRTGALRNGNSTACGHCRTPSYGARKHGYAPANGQGPTYTSWRCMRGRCRNRDEYTGIAIDPRWDDFTVFIADMGERPAGTTLDRRDNGKGYFPENCRWATPAEQTRNRRIAKTFEFQGREMPIAEWAKEFGISYGAAIARIKRYGSLLLPTRS